MNKLKYILIVMAVLLGLFMLTGMFYGLMFDQGTTLNIRGK
jgi:hypothetical protein